MKCPRCGKTNGKTNKYCRECGIRLPKLVEDQPKDHSPVRDEVGVGEELFEVWELVEAGDLDGALAKGEAMVESNPDSASAHSLVALICERKAEGELEQGYDDQWQKFIKLAVAQYEKIIDLNPGSTADREKLASLRKKLAGVAVGPVPIVGFRAALKALPRPVIAGFAVFIIILMLAIILYPGRQPAPVSAGSTGTNLGSPSGASPPVSAAVTHNAPKSPPRQTLKVYNYPASPRTAAAAPARAPKPRSKPARSDKVQSIKLPSFSDVGVAVISEPDDTVAAAGGLKPEQPPEPAANEETTVVVEPAAPRPITGSRMLAEAIQLHGQGHADQAIGAAEQAIALYQAEIDAGRNPDSAKRGARNAKNLIKVWHQE